MARPFFRVSEEIREDNIHILNKLIEAASIIGAKAVEMPLVDNSSIKDRHEREVFITSIRRILPAAQRHGISLGLETDLPPREFLGLLEEFNHPLVRANYDSGNSASKGYDPYEEITALRSYILNVHIKDRVFQGATVSLSAGDVNFERLFMTLKRIEYRNSFILQAARGEDGNEVSTIRKQMNFVKRYIDKYLG